LPRFGGASSCGSPILLHHSRALAQGDFRLRPALARGEVGCDCHLEILCTDHVLEDAISGIVPNVNLGARLHGALFPRP
jgi:hypothetical protein